MSDFRKAMLGTAIPLLALGVISLGFRIAGRFISGGRIVSVSLGFPVLIFWVLALFTAVGFVIAGRRQIAAGMFTGVAIGLVGLGLSCFGLVF
jgi:hypothetical protein